MAINVTKVNYVWYASYGSNLNRERFLCYLQGGRPKGSQKKEVGCRDTSLPIKDETYVLHHPLYFAKQSSRWQRQGVAFIGLKEATNHKTYSRKYLITRDQFYDIVKQENNGIALEIDFDDVIKSGYKTLKDSWYGTIIYVGEAGGIPIFTFTSNWDLNVSFTKPSAEYLQMIIEGLRTTLGLNQSEIVQYLQTKPGIKGNYIKTDLENLCKW